MIIAIDGNHRVGKSTLIKNLQKVYADNQQIVFLKYPTFTDIGEFAKKKVETESNEVSSLLFAADITSCYQKSIQEDSNKIYILDRYILSLFAFQGKENKSNYRFLYGITENIQYPDIQIVICKKDETININDELFVKTSKNLQKDGKIGRIYIVQNILTNRENPDYTGFYEVKKIIDSVVYEKTE